MSSTSVAVVFRQLLEGFHLINCARRFADRFARAQLLHLLSRPVRSCLGTQRIFTCWPALVRDFPVPFPILEGEQAQIHQTPATFHDTDHHCTVERGLCIVAPETRNGQSCALNNPFQPCQWPVCIACGLALLPTLRASVAETVSDSFDCFVALLRSSGELRMIVRSRRLNLTLSAHWSDVSGSHGKITSKSPRLFNVFTHHITANVSCCTFRFNNCGCVVANRFVVHA